MHDPNQQAVIPKRQVFRAANTTDLRGNRIARELVEEGAIELHTSPAGRDWLTPPHYAVLWRALWQRP